MSEVTQTNVGTSWHSPPYNSRNIETYNGQRLEVVNLGNYGSLYEKYRSRDRKRWGGQETTLSLLIMKKRWKRKGNNYESLDAAKH